MKYGIFFVDASFNKKYKSSNFGFYEIIYKLKKTKTLQGEFNNSKEAEKKAIIETIHIALKNKYENIIIFNDNKFAIKEIKKIFYENLNYKHMFAYIQFVWIPRDFNKLADFLSKNFNMEDIENKNNKTNQQELENKINSLINFKEKNYE